MSTPVDLYDNAYGNYAAEIYRQVRIATYGEDFGQTSWVTNEESREIPQALGITSGSRVLEIGCGSGGYALHVAETTGCTVVGVDVNEAGIRNGKALSSARNLSDRVLFEHCDASQKLPAPDASFDAAFANDVLCHIPGRPALLQDVFRVLKPQGRFLFSDALVIGGAISHEEVATRSSIGYYLFTPPAYNELLIREAGFRLILVNETTESTACIAGRWLDARHSLREALIAVEGRENFDGLQQFLTCVCRVSQERRLRRYLYVAQKDQESTGLQ